MLFVRLIRMAEKAFWFSFETTDVIVFADHIIQRTRNSYQKGKLSTLRLLLQISYILDDFSLKTFIFSLHEIRQTKAIGECLSLAGFSSQV
jgi:hypothetical protein